MKRTQILIGIILLVVGFVVAGFLFYVGESDDAPGLCAIGVSIGVVSLFWSLKRWGVIRKGQFAPIMLAFFGVFSAAITTSILLDNEFAGMEWMYAVGYGLAAVLMVWAFFLFRKRRTFTH